MLSMGHRFRWKSVSNLELSHQGMHCQEKGCCRHCLALGTCSQCLCIRTAVLQQLHHTPGTFTSTAVCGPGIGGVSTTTLTPPCPAGLICTLVLTWPGGGLGGLGRLGGLQQTGQMSASTEIVAALSTLLALHWPRRKLPCCLAKLQEELQVTIMLVLNSTVPRPLVPLVALRGTTIGRALRG